MKTLKEALFSRKNIKNSPSNDIIQFTKSNGDVWRFEYLENKVVFDFKVGTEENYVLIEHYIGTTLYKNIIRNKCMSMFSIDAKKYLWYDKDGEFSILNSRGDRLDKIELNSKDLLLVRDWLKEHFYEYIKNTKAYK